MLAPAPDERAGDMESVENDLKAWLLDSGLGDWKAELKQFISDPERYAGEIPARVTPAVRFRAQAAARTGDRAAALNYCNRALALTPEDPATLKIVSYIRMGALLKRIAIAASSVLVMGAVAAAAIYHFGQSTCGTGRQELGRMVVTEEPSQPPPEAKEWDDILEQTRFEPAARQASPHASSEIRKAPRIPTPPKVKVIKPASIEPRKLALTEIPPGEVRVFIKPYADIYVDGELRSSDSRDAVFMLPPGPHRLEFRNRFFESQVSEVTVPSDGTIKELRVELLNVKPAFLKVEGPPGAAIYVNGVFKGTTESIGHDPIVVPISRDPASKKVRLRIVKKGYKDLELVKDLIPGMVNNVTAVLTQEAPSRQ
jgi:hypothetical protein